jgi:hypothetical protein
MNGRSRSHGNKSKKKNMFRWPSMHKNGCLKSAQNKLNDTLTLWMLKKHLGKEKNGKYTWYTTTTTNNAVRIDKLLNTIYHDLFQGFGTKRKSIVIYIVMSFIHPMGLLPRVATPHVS